MRRMSIAAAQLVLLGAGFASFVALTPWLACKPLSELPPERSARLVVPPSARCFTYEHGEVDFHDHGLIAEEPVRFGLHVLGVAGPVLLLLFSARSRS